MKAASQWMAGAVAASLLVLCTAAQVHAQEPEPFGHQVLFDNPHIRILEIRLLPGERTEMHSHSANITYALTSFTLKIDRYDGTTALVQRNPGDLCWSGPARLAAENVGETAALLVMCEMRPQETRLAEVLSLLSGPVPPALPQPRHAKPVLERDRHRMLTPDQVKWIDKPAGFPAGVKMANLEGDPAKPGPFTIRLFAPAGMKVPAHWHPADEQITVLSGAIHMGLGEVFDKSKTHKYPAGSFLVMPAESRHFAWVAEDTIVQIHAMGPWGMNYVNPADDPRKK